MANGPHVKLEKKITDLSKALAQLGRDADLRELLRTIRRPGWTTPAELVFALGLVDAALGQAQALTMLTAALVSGAGLVSSNPMPGVVKARRRAA